ncbi:MAG TPA: NTP transferase domain-containing protein [bacterium]|nr:NTP transferase domain-containing protein [bacterium]
MPERTGTDASRSVDAVVLAGGPPAPELTGGALPKAFAPVGSATMVEHVLAALRAVPDIRRIVLVAPAPLPPHIAAAASLSVPARAGVLDNLAAGLAVLEEAPEHGGLRSAAAPVLVAAADVPLLTSPAVAAFLDAGRAAAADAVYAIVPRDEVVRVAPGIRKTFVRLADGVFAGGGLVLLRPGAFERARPLIERAVRARKRPWELARLFGLGTLVGLATGRLRIAALERRAEALGVRARAVVCQDAGVALDVDTPEMLAFVRARAARRDDARVPAGRGGV